MEVIKPGSVQQPEEDIQIPDKRLEVETTATELIEEAIIDRVGDYLEAKDQDFDLAQFRELKKTYYSGEGSDKEAFGNPEDPEALENLILDIFWRMDEVIAKQNKRYNLIKDLEDDEESFELTGKVLLTQAVRQKKVAELNEVNVLTAGWQNDVVRVTLALEESPQGKEFLKIFWRTYEQVNKWKEEVSAVKTGIMGVITTIKIMEAKGCEVILPTGEEDAIDKVDLFARKGDKFYAIQIKSHDRRDVRAKFEVVTDRYIPAAEFEALTPEEKKILRARRKLLMVCYKYSKILGRPVIPGWMDLDCPGGTRFDRNEIGIPQADDLAELPMGEELE